MKNYINLGKNFLGTWEHYLYLDTEELLARSLILRHMVHVKVDGVMEKENEEYRLISLKVLKKDEPMFLRCMEELKGKMLLFGHTDYEARCEAEIGLLRDVIRKEAEETGRVQLPTGGSIRAGALTEL